MVKKGADFWISIGLLAFCAFAAWRTSLLPSMGTGTQAGPTFFPWLMIGGMALLSAAMLVRSLVAGSTKGEGSEIGARTLLRIGAFLLLMLAYAFSFVYLGYIVSTVAVFILGMLFLGERRVIFFAGIPVVIVLVIYFLFTKFLGVYLP
ncbi:tripartite tricarboxylate transporter TctB family protein [Telmatospirillum sp. J64-1]|uniref:tripartite tricarboxylate transporter TctB family protein n=1 Tax=Telmatospirillum sp. J64-1 TaxID=2502183 RepID=UPI00115D78F5|nr:tripartite tricarboxylate transporter TctB family protein [Telmatospirillum sp. J64-1]